MKKLITLSAIILAFITTSVAQAKQKDIGQWNPQAYSMFRKQDSYIELNNKKAEKLFHYNGYTYQYLYTKHFPQGNVYRDVYFAQTTTYIDFEGEMTIELHADKNGERIIPKPYTGVLANN